MIYLIKKYSKIKMEKFLEGGISTRSCYYRFADVSSSNETKSEGAIGIGMSSFDPNEILGFCSHDADTSHSLKSLKPSMNAKSISDILDGKDTYIGEIALQRYKYNINEISEGENGGRVSPTYIFSAGNRLEREWGKAFNVPIVRFDYSSDEKRIENIAKVQKSLLDERIPKRERKRGKIVFDVIDVINRETQLEKRTSEDKPEYVGKEIIEDNNTRLMAEQETKRMIEKVTENYNPNSTMKQNDLVNEPEYTVDETKFAQIYNKSRSKVQETLKKIKEAIIRRQNKQERQNNSNEQYK